MKKIKIAFCGHYNNNMVHNFFLRVCSNVILELSDDPDFVICGVFNNEWQNFNKNVIRIYFYTENIMPDFNKFDYAIGFNDIKFGNRHFYYPCGLRYKMYDLLGKDNKELPDSMTQRKFCNFIYSNANSGGAVSIRNDFYNELVKYKHIDCHGKVFNNMPKDSITPRNGDWISGKLETLKEYKFSICFENSIQDGYTTEKLSFALLSNTIPIYFGAPDVDRYYNKDAFICVNDYPDMDAVIQKVIELDTDNQKYMHMLRQPPLVIDSLPDIEKELSEFMNNIFTNGKKFTSDLNLHLISTEKKKKEKHRSFWWHLRHMKF